MSREADAWIRREGAGTSPDKDCLEGGHAWNGEPGTQSCDDFFFSSVVVLNDCCPSERVYCREQWALLGGGVEVTPGRRGNDGWSTA